MLGVLHVKRECPTGSLGAASGPEDWVMRSVAILVDYTHNIKIIK